LIIFSIEILFSKANYSGSFSVLILRVLRAIVFNGIESNGFSSVLEFNLYRCESTRGILDCDRA
jgi:hypothetical protein